MKYGARRVIALVVVLSVMAAVFACGHSPNNSGIPKSFSSRKTGAQAEYLVTLAPGADVKVISALYGRYGIKETKDLGRNVFRVVITDDPGPARMEQLHEQSAYITAVQPDE